MKKTKQILALLLAVLMILPTLAACSHTDEKLEDAITATPVQYSKSGKYTTTVSSKEVDLSGITADNVEVRYMDPDFIPEGTSSGYAKEVSEETSTEATTEATTEAAAEKVNPEKIYTLLAKVESVKASDKKTGEITFTDDKAADFLTRNYIILFKGVEGDINTAEVAVEFPEITLTPDVENVVSDATQAKVTFAIDGSTFEDGISEKDIYLDNAFSEMKIESMSSSDKYLTVQLKGTPVKSAAGAYQWGSVNVKPSGIKDGYSIVTSKVDIKLATVNIDASTLKFENGKISADLKVYGVVDINTLTKDNIKIDGATVEAAEKADDNTVRLTVAADGVNSANDFADLFGEKAMKLGDYKTKVSVSQASFYPVFDYVEEDGDNLKLTLILYANSGTFDESLKADAFSFSDDFDGATVDSVTVDSDTVATLVVSVPANGQTTETMKLNGTVTLAEGAVANLWGDKTSKEYSYTRNYSGETLGRDISLNTDTLLEIQKYTRGKNTVFGQICYWGGTAGQVFSIAKTVLEVAGVVKSEHVQVMEKLEEISGKIDGVLHNQEKIMNMLDKLDKAQKEFQNDDYKDKLDKLNNYVNIMEDQLKAGALYMALNDAKERGEIDEIPSFSGLEGEALDAAVKEYEKYIPDIDKMSELEAYEYSDRLVDFIIDESKNEKTRRFASFKSNNDNLRQALLDVTDKLNRTDGTNPMQRYDELCALKYNFDSQCYYFRSAQRDTALALMGRAMAVVAITEKGFTDPLNANFKNAKKQVTDASKLIEEEYIDNLGYAPEQIKANPRIKMVGTNNTYISEIAVGGDKDSAAAKKALTDKGYTVYDRDLNEGAGGHFIYLGYKTTKDYNEAIKWIHIYSSIDAKPHRNLLDKVVPAYGDSGFVNSYSDLNYDAGGLYVYLFTSKSEGGSHHSQAISDIYVNSTKQGSVDEHDMNDSAGGSDLYLHCDWAFKSIATDKVLDTDPEYYPYSYVLGKKVALGTKCNLANRGIMPNTAITSALQESNGSYRNWTQDEMDAFVKHMTNSTLEQELKSAGINGFSRNLAMTFNTYYFDLQTYTSVFGNYMGGKSNQVQSCDMYEKYGLFWNKLEKDKVYGAEDFSYFMLYDYARNGNAQEIDKTNDLLCRAHVEGIGWMNWVSPDGNNAAFVGTVSQSRRMEALMLLLTDEDNKPMLTYRAHVQGRDWMDWKDSDGAYIGTAEQSLRMEAVEIKLKDEYADKYDIEYRAYMQNHGWLGWVKNGQTAGITGQSLRMEAIEIKLVKKK